MTTEIIRSAMLADIPSFLEIKRKLAISVIPDEQTTQGFLLGTDAEMYKTYIENGFCLVAEVDGEVIGFGIAFTNNYFKNSELWKRRANANWFIEIDTIENQPIGYLEQLAFSRKYRRLIIRLAYMLLNNLFENGHTILITTTVQKPILNLAAVPFITAAGGQKIGFIDEEYPVVGQIVSDIYLIQADIFKENVQNHPVKKFLTDVNLTNSERTKSIP